MIVLIVDDLEEKMKKIEAVIYETYDNSICKILKAKNSSNAIQILLSENKIDLMILDLNLPVRDGEWPKQNSGLKLLREIIKRSELTRPESIIGLTAHSEIKENNQILFNKEGWTIAHFDPKFSEWEDVIKNKLTYLYGKNYFQKINNHKTKPMDTSNELPTVVILTAIKEEYLAVREHLVEIDDADRNDTTYESGLFFHNDKKISKVIIRECGAKNANASQEVERAIQYFSPNCILFVGIAGSRKPNDFKIGDVIIPEKIYSYEGGKATENSFMARPDLEKLSYSLFEKAKKERLKEDWKKLIKGNYELSSKAELGIIASGDQLIEHYNSSIGQILLEHYNDTSAVEMEGFGFAKAASNQGRETSNIIFGVVRGISDILEQNNSAILNQDRRPDNAKLFAADTASAFAFWLLFKIYDN